MFLPNPLPGMFPNNPLFETPLLRALDQLEHVNADQRAMPCLTPLFPSSLASTMMSNSRASLH